MTCKEAASRFSFLDGEMALLAKLLYDTGMRLMKGLRLWIKDVDFDRRMIVIRDGKDRAVLLPQSRAPELEAKLLQARAVWCASAIVQRSGFETPHALEKKYPKVGHTLGWFCLPPTPTL